MAKGGGTWIRLNEKNHILAPDANHHLIKNLLLVYCGSLFLTQKIITITTQRFGKTAFRANR